MSTFKLKQFDLKQSDSLQKMGSDTMLLGASVVGDFKSILDVGTGTGILALMMAQTHPQAKVFAIEPHLPSFEEAKFNFSQSQFASRLQIVPNKLQTYQPTELFDLIISNPPYYENSTLGQNEAKNSARHTLNLSIDDFYKYTSKFLSQNGELYLIFPSDLLRIHKETALRYGLCPKRIITVVKDNQKPIRNIVNYSKNRVQNIEESSITIALSSGKYSDAYIKLTKDFYAHDLSKK